MKAIVYTSNTGHTKRYAELLGARAGLPVYTVSEAKLALAPGEEILYMGWLFASRVKGYPRAAKRYRVIAVCGVGLGDTGAQDGAVRAAEKIPAEVPVFTLQGGMDLEKLRGVHRFMIRMLTKMLTAKDDRTAEEEQMLALLVKGGDYVSESHLQGVLEWLRGKERDE